MLFPPVEALQKFGRRRKITNDDRERLRSSVLRPKLTYGPKHRRGAESEESIQDLDIRINGQPVGASYPGFHGPPTDATSQSMLLDQESPPTTPKPLVHEYVCGNVGVRSSVGDRSWILDSSSISPLCVSSSDRGLSTRENSIVRGSDYFVDNFTGKEQFQVTGSEPLQSADTSPKVQGTPIRRRFTIDDQILAEEEWMKAAYGTSLERDGYSTAHQFSQSLLNPELSSPTANDSRRQISEQESMSTSSTLNHSSYGWLPEPRHNIQRFISQRTDKGQLDKVPSESTLGSTSLAPLSRKPTAPPLIIFGQAVNLDGSLFATKQVEHEKQQAQHVFTCPATTFREASNSYISTDNYPFETNLRRPDNFTFSPNTVKLSKPTVTPRAARIYIDQACATLSRTAGPERVFPWRHPEDRPAQEWTNRRSLYN